MAMDNSRICSMSVVRKTLYSYFTGQGSYYSYTHAWTKLTMKSRAESSELIS